MHREVQRVEALGYVPLVYGATMAPPTGPELTSQPLEVTVAAGATANLAVSVGASQGGLIYQWRKDGVPMSDGPLAGAAAVSGTRSPNLQITGAGTGALAVYSALVSDEQGHSASLGTTLLINDHPATPPCAADFNGDGRRNPDDLSEFITCFFLQIQFPGFCSSGDFNRDTIINPDDLSEFITMFFLGC
jgi:hypothetical protein